MNLRGDQRKKLQEALIEAFPKKSSLEQLLALELSKNLDAIAGGNSLEDIIFNLIKTVDSEGWIEDLIRAARKSNPGNKRLRDVTEELLSNDHIETPFIPSPNIHPELSTQTHSRRPIKKIVKIAKVAAAVAVSLARQLLQAGEPVQRTALSWRFFKSVLFWRFGSNHSLP